MSPSDVTAGTLPTVPAGVQLICVGASAGGVEALGVLLDGLPAGCQVAVAVVLHIPPRHTSRLAEVFQPRCKLPVKEVEDKEPVLAGCVYVAAPAYHMLVEPDHSFSLSCDEPVNHSRPSIDLLFESAAAAYGKQVLGIILTGASADGAVGLTAIRELGGGAWVQDPNDARVPAMPAAALAQAGADHVLTVRNMAQALSRLPARPQSFQADPPRQ